MDQQIAQTLWLPPGTCVLNALPHFTQQTIPAVTAYQPTNHQVLKHQQPIIPPAIPTSSVIPNTTLLPQHNILSPSQGFVQVPAFDGVLLTPDGKQIFEIPAYTPTNVIPGLSLTWPHTTLLPNDIRKTQRIDFGSKVMKKKRISPSAKRRSRMRLIAFLEAKKKQQEHEESSSENLSTSSTSPDDVKIAEDSRSVLATHDEDKSNVPNSSPQLS